MKYLVLGSAGQIGSSLTKYLRKSKHKVLEFDLEDSPEQDLRISDNPLLDKYLKQADFCFFLAFDVGGSRYLKKYQESYQFVSNNTKIMNNTFDLLKKHKRKFIFASSQMSNMSFSNYGRLKAVGEAYTQALGGLVVKFWNVYGVEKDLNKAHVITDFILKAEKERQIDMLTNGLEERQFLHADDCSRCLKKLSLKYDKIPRDQELHAKSFKWQSIIEVATITASHFEGTAIIPGKSVDDLQKAQRNEPDTNILEYWRPRISLENGIGKVIKEMSQLDNKLE